MKTPLWLRLISSLTVFFVLAYLLFEFSAGFRYFVMQRVGTIDLAFRNEYEPYPRRLIKSTTTFELVSIFSPPVLAAIYVFKRFERTRLQFSMRAIFLAFLGVGLFITFGRRPNYELLKNEWLATILGMGYAILLLIISWACFLGLRELEIKEGDECPQDSQ